MAGAVSLSVRGQNAVVAARTLADTALRLGKPAGALIFASGSLGEQIEPLARAFSRYATSVPALVVSGAGVLTEKGEIERDSAAAAVAWSGGRSTVAVFQDMRQAMAERKIERWTQSSPRSSGLALFLRSDALGRGALTLDLGAAGVPVFGGGAVGNPGVVAVDEQGEVHSGECAAMLIGSSLPPTIKSSPGCRLLTPLRTITKARGALVLRIDDEPALDVLTAATSRLPDQPLVFAALAPDAPPSGDGRRPNLRLRAIGGIDPGRRALLISDEAREGVRLAFAVRDAQAARADFETVTRDLTRELAGAAPRFGVYLNCAGRGSSMYGSADVDTRILRNRFGELPLAGMNSAFEIAESAGTAAIQLYTGVLALFRAPS
jgi:small ligand-binding sensory domain FIST